jgi:hypothetical protein
VRSEQVRVFALLLEEFAEVSADALGLGRVGLAHVEVLDGEGHLVRHLA